MWKVRLNDGTLRDVNYCAETETGNLQIELTGLESILPVVQEWTDPGKTCEIHFLYGEMEDVYRDYIRLTGVLLDVNRHTCRVTLRREG